MKNLLKPIAVFALLTAVFFACQKDNKDAPTTDTRKFDGFPESTKPNAINAFDNSGSKWNKCNLTYHIVKASNKPNIAASAEMQAYRNAFKAWQDASALKFIEVFSALQADIVINHKDDDGQNGVLGYAYFPCETSSICGDIFLTIVKTGLWKNVTLPRNQLIYTPWLCTK